MTLLRLQRVLLSIPSSVKPYPQTISSSCFYQGAIWQKAVNDSWLMKVYAFPCVVLRLPISKRSNGTRSGLHLWSLRYGYWAKLLLILNNIVLQCGKQALGMLRCKDYARAHLWLRHAWQYACEVDDEVAVRV